MQGSPSSGQVVGQVLGGSQVSPASTFLSPQVAWQSVSVAGVQPEGQQPSPLKQATIAVCVQWREQSLLEPLAMSPVQASPSSQVSAQAPGNPAVIARSHCSPASTTPSPQIGEQSGSLAAVQPSGQQESPPTQAVMGLTTQAALQVAGSPRTLEVAHEPVAGQVPVFGQDPSTASSQVSTGGSTTPLPQTAAQSASTASVPPGGQQPSPATNAVTARCWQFAAHVPAETSRSVVQGSPSSQLVGQAPGVPAGIAVSQASPGWTAPSPQVGEQSGSSSAVHPAGQQPSLTGPQLVMGVSVQAAEQARPVNTSCRQTEGDGGQPLGLGQAPGPAACVSQVSPGSTMPSPQVAAQSLSVARVAPVGQQPSPEIADLIRSWTQVAWQPEPTRKSVVQGLPSSQVVGQLPGAGGGMPTSQVSTLPLWTWRTPSPHRAGQSPSTALVAPGGQQPSPELGWLTW